MLFLLRLKVGKKPAPEPSRRRVLSPVDRLDLDDLGPEVAQQHAAGGAHHHAGELDDADARRSGRGGPDFMTWDCFPA